MPFGVARHNIHSTPPVPAGTALDPATSAWVAAVVSAGGSVSSGRQTLVNTLITSLKSAGVWSLLDVFWLFAAENTQSALLDLKGLTTATTTGSPSFTTDQGYTANSTPGYVNTGFNPSTGSPVYAQDSAHFGFYSRTNQAALSSVEMGNSDNTADFGCNLSVKWVDGNCYFALNDANLDAGRAAATNDSGIWVVSRTGSTTATAYQAGSSFASNGQTSTDVPTHAYLVGNALDHTGATAGIFSTCQFGMASAGGGFSAQNVTDYTNAAQTYMTAIGA